MITVSYNDLAGKHVLVTGGASGIGAAIVSAFHGQRAKVSILDLIDPDTASGAMAFERCDLRDPRQIESSTLKVYTRIGPIDVLINNAANDSRHTLSEIDSDRWDDLIAVNLRASFLTARAVSAGMVKVGSGNIINISSNCFLLGLAGYPVYATAKAGLWGMTKALARELGPGGVRVNCLAPGWVATERQKNEWMTPDALAECLDGQCIKRVIVPDDIAQACLFLASDASRMIAGQMLVVDGGRI